MQWIVLSNDLGLAVERRVEKSKVDLVMETNNHERDNPSTDGSENNSRPIRELGASR